MMKPMGLEAGNIASLMPDRAPQALEAFGELLAVLDRIVMPGITHWQSPNWFAYFPANTSPLVCFSHVEGDDATEHLATALNASGKVAETPSVIDDRSFIRVSIGQTYTDEVHVKRLQALIDEIA